MSDLENLKSPSDSELRPFMVTHSLDKWYGSTHAVNDISFHVNYGEFLAVVGENGAGKSTLMRMLSGTEAPSSGSIEIEGEHVSWKHPEDARASGVIILHQEPQVFPALSALENVFQADLKETGSAFIDWQRVEQKGRSLCARVGLDPAVMAMPMGALTIGTQQLLYLGHALESEPRVLILDEPTAILSGAETEDLFRAIEELRAKSPKTSFIYISHRLNELEGRSDRAVVLRNGSVVGVLEKEEQTEERLVELMTGGLDLSARANTGQRGKRDKDAKPALELDGVTLPGEFTDVSLALYPGEVCGLYGLVGSGRSELAMSIFGATHPPTSGRVSLKGKPVKFKFPLEAINAGLVYVPEDRIALGNFDRLPISFNLIAALRRNLLRLGIIDGKKERRISQESSERSGVVYNRLSDPIMTLSGGNQQKVLIARWLALDSSVMIIDEPTRGVDVGAKAEIHRQIRNATNDGMAVLMISSDLSEVLQNSDRVLVARTGRIVSELQDAEITEENIIKHALGFVEAV